MVYRSTTYKYKGRTKTYYIVYKQTWMHNYRGHRKKRTQIRVNRVYISGKLIKVSKPGYYKNKKGRRVYGIKFEYENPIAAAKVRPYTAHRGRTKYRVSGKTLPRRKATVSKIIEIPKNAKNIKITTRPPKGPLMAVK